MFPRRRHVICVHVIRPSTIRTAGLGEDGVLVFRLFHRECDQAAECLGAIGQVMLPRHFIEVLHLFLLEPQR